jgi:hypothetical protein
MTIIEDGTCKVTWCLYDFEHPKWEYHNAYKWGFPLERTMERLLEEHPAIIDYNAVYISEAAVTVEYDSIRTFMEYHEKDRKWILRYFKKYLAEEIAEEKRLIKEQQMIEEAEELEFLVNEALGD